MGQLELELVDGVFLGMDGLMGGLGLLLELLVKRVNTRGQRVDQRSEVVGVERVSMGSSVENLG